ncbi:MAG: hypothetical protein DWQ05_01235 [Calditrichaeota bacterium]|nr:MAG: hypothetical protein DWQ05_01235 [Calditrichota bacterium]
MKKHINPIVLQNENGQAKVLVAAEYQGRVMTSTASGDAGLSFGWLNYDLIASGKFGPHINAFGGEDRFWLGPEGGQFSLFFKNGDPFDLAHWQTPPAIDSEPFEIVAQSKTNVSFRKKMQLLNYSNSRFDLQIDREIHLLNEGTIAEKLGMKIESSVNSVAFESINKITNIGKSGWKKKTGLLSIWILGMLNPSDETIVVIPLRGSARINDNYFGKVPPERLVVRNQVAFFKGDGKMRSKIGVPPGSTRPILGSYDAINKILTIVQFTFDSKAEYYVNSAWEMQQFPYKGDVINSYNDGPPSPGAKALGPFYELESSSAARELNPGESCTHIHSTFHFTGPESVLDKIAQNKFGVGLTAIKSALKQVE